MRGTKSSKPEAMQNLNWPETGIELAAIIFKIFIQTGTHCCGKVVACSVFQGTFCPNMKSLAVEERLNACVQFSIEYLEEERVGLDQSVLSRNVCLNEVDINIRLNSY